jgi:hypothetical protein
MDANVCSNIAYPAYTREKARELRIEKRLSLLEIAERLSLPKTTVFYWIRDLPDPAIKHRNMPGRRRARADVARRNAARFKALRDAAYVETGTSTPRCPQSQHSLTLSA